MSTVGALEATAKRDRFVLCTALAATALLAWAYLVYHARAMSDTVAMETMPGMAGMADMATHTTRDWSGLDLVLLFAMWAIMMLGMMAPAATPMILLVARVSRQRGSSVPIPRARAFAAGYFLVWTGFGLVATLAQWGLHEAALLSPMMHATAVRGRRAASRCRSLSVGAAEETVPRPLPLAAVIPHQSLARRLNGRPRYGRAAWRVLRRLLLDADGAALRRRCDEPLVGGGDYGLRLRRTAGGEGRCRRASCRRGARDGRHCIDVALNS